MMCCVCWLPGKISSPEVSGDIHDDALATLLTVSCWESGRPRAPSVSGVKPTIATLLPPALSSLLVSFIDLITISMKYSKTETWQNWIGTGVELCSQFHSLAQRTIKVDTQPKRLRKPKPTSVFHTK